MTIGPEPRTRMERRSVRLGMAGGGDIRTFCTKLAVVTKRLEREPTDHERGQLRTAADAAQGARGDAGGEAVAPRRGPAAERSVPRAVQTGGAIRHPPRPRGDQGRDGGQGGVRL